MARLGQIIKKLNIGINTAAEFLNKKGESIEQNPHIQLTEDQENLLLKEFSSDKTLKEKSDKLIQKRLERETSVILDIDEDKSKTEPSPKKKVIKETKVEKNKTKKQESPVEVSDSSESDTPIVEETQIEPIEQEDSSQDSTVEEKKIKKASEKKTNKSVEKEETVEETPVKAEETHESAPQKVEEQPVATVEGIVEVEKPKAENMASQDEEGLANQTPKTTPTDILQTELSDDNREETNDILPSDIVLPVNDEDTVEQNKEPEIFKFSEKKLEAPKVLGTIDLSLVGKDSRPHPKTKAERKKEIKEAIKKKKEDEKRIKTESQKEVTSSQQTKTKTEQPKEDEKGKENFIRTKVPTLQGPKVVDKVNLDSDKHSNKEHDKDKNRADKNNNNKKDKKKRDRIKIERVDISEDKNRSGKAFKKERRSNRPIVDVEDVNQNIKETLAIAREGRKFNKKSADYRKEKRENIRQEIERQAELEMAQSKVLTLSEFVTTNELASMMQVPVNDVIKVYMNLGMFVGINQRIDAESIKIVADEFGFETNFVSAEAAKTIQDEDIDAPEDLVSRPPIITVMGHVDHGKTSLLDYIRKTNVIAGEAGGITQHIGAYNVKLEDGRQITFIDTPGHEAFTAMRARGAKVTDIAIIIVAADDDVMPQTIEAINHAASANVPIVFAINKIDKDGADPEKIKATLANMNYMVESWGGKYQSQDISAKKGIGVNELLEKVLLESELLELRANPKRKAVGSVIDVRKDKGRGNEITLLVQNGTLRQGDIVLAGYSYGKIRAMFNERSQPIKEAKPSEPVLVLGMKGELQAGDNFNVMETEQAAREIIAQRDQLKREQKLRTSRHLTLDEIGRRIALGNFQEFNIIVKGDVDGSIEALSDSLIKLSTNEIQVNVIHKGIGQITEGDVNLAISSNAIIVGFQVRPTTSAKQLADTEKVDIRIYSIIYQAIEEIKSAMEGMLLPEKSEKVVATLEVRNTFHISKVGTIAGCMVKEGTIKRNNKIRVIHDGIVIHTGDIASLKHEKDDVREIKQGYECGVNLSDFNNISVGDIIEAFEEIEIKKTLD